MAIYLKRVTSLFLTCMIFMFTIGQNLVPIIGHIVNAQELNSTGFVDSFKIDKTTLQYGEQTGIRVNFSDKSGNNMKSGDTLTLSLPTELRGFKVSIPLNNDQNRNFGTCEVNDSNVVCTFNDTVEKLQNIRGHFNFTVQASNIAVGEEKNVQTNLGTNLESQTVTIVNPNGGGTEPGQFFYKSGDIQPDKADEVRWFLNMNLKKEQLNSDIVLSDSLQEGQTLNKNSFGIEVNGNRPLSIEEFQNQGYGLIKFTGDNLFEVIIYKNSANGKSFTISYKATINESGKKQEFFKNNYTINYQVMNEEAVSNSDSASVKNIAFGGGAEGDLPPKGTLRIIKHLEGDEEKVISNVSFKLYTESGQQVGDVFTTDGQGMVEITGLNPGNYYVQEISAPKYIDFDPQAKISFKIDSNATAGVKLPIPNKIKTINIPVLKKWVNATEIKPNIQIQLLNGHHSDANVSVLQTINLNNGKTSYTFENLPKYNEQGEEIQYDVIENSIPDGYESVVTGTPNEGFTITNTKKEIPTVSVTGTKTWKDENAKDRPKMIKVDLLQNGQVVATQEVTEATGWKYEFKDLAGYDAEGKAYKYEVKEQPVDGYKTEVKGYDITNTKVSQTTVTGTKTWKDENAKDRPKMIKVDLLQNGQVVATQEVTEATGWKYEFKDLAGYDAEGKAYKYEVKEQPVDGYKTEVKGYDITNTKIKDPKDPTNTGANNDSKVPPTTENDKSTGLLPKTGGTPTEIISIVGGILLLVLGGILFVRQRVQ
ncbi:adhesin [Bacillus sp. MYb209]|uniref:Cna B-type domain-containing protein n=1 Tax=Bacillus sp. MYb209 TaxID=1848605 RepID=UPI000CFC5862|nr:Cna B-type domain-containing protein [Bacillus sp. MYb209]PQZ48747.1 adhesin [Bacillus sp. MYb209]